MRKAPRGTSSGLYSTFLFSGLFLWCLAGIALGAMWTSESWGMVVLVGGSVAAAAVLVSLMLRMWRLAVFSVVGLSTLSMFVTGVLLGSEMYIAAGGVGIVFVTVAAALSYQLSSRPTASGATENAGTRSLELLEHIHEYAMMSDSAKRVLFREREIQLLRNAIEEDISRGDYDAALILCDDMAGLFGYREEAESFRAQILTDRHEHYEQEARAALAQLDYYLEQRDWARAHQEAGKMRRLYPESHVIGEIDKHIGAARRAHKAELENEFTSAVERDDVEAAMELLRSLDRYLTHDEATKLAEVAQSVVSKHRENLSVQFKMAVNDHRWDEAISIGESIIDEFPNAKMASEVQSMIPVLRQRAGQAAAPVNS